MDEGVLTNTVQSISMATSGMAPRARVAAEARPVSFKPVAGIGLNTMLRDSFFYVSKNEVVYSIGKHVVVQNVHSQKMTFFDAPTDGPGGNLTAGEVTAMALTTKRNFLAVARGPTSTTARTHSTIAIYGLQKAGTKETDDIAVARTITYPTHSFVSLAFSVNGKFLVAQSSTANWSFVLWDWTRARKIAVAEVHAKVTRVHFNPIDVAQMSTSGGVHLRLWKLAEPTCRQFATFTAAVKYVDHAWIPKSDGLVALLESGDVQHIFNGELVRTLQALHHGHYLSSLQTFKSSIVIGGNDGWVSVLDVAEVETSGAVADVSLSRRMQLDTKEPILALAVDAVGAAFMCVTPSFYGAYELSNMCLLRADDEPIALATFAPLARPTSLAALATATRRHVFAALGKANTGGHAVGIYTQDVAAGQLHHGFGHLTPIDLALHPSGFEVLVSFSVQLHIYHVLFDTFKVAFEVEVRHATSVAYSHGGSYFYALVEERYIYVYRYHGATEPTLLSICKGHDFNIGVLCWGVDDTHFYSGDERGGVRQWTFNSDSGFVATSATFNDAERPRAYSAMATTVHATTGKRVLAAAFVTGTGMGAVHVWPEGNFDVPPIKTHEIEVPVTALACSSALCVGLSSGTLLLFHWEALEDGSVVLGAKPLIVDLSPSPIVALRLFHSGLQLLVAAVDGVVITGDLCVQSPAPSIEPPALLLPPDSAFVTVVPTDDLCLVSFEGHEPVVERNSVTERLLHIADLEAEKDQLRMEKEIVSKLNSEQRTLLERERQMEVRAVRTALEAQVRAVEDALARQVQEAEAASASLKESHARDSGAMQSILTTKIDTLHDVCAHLELDLIKARQHVDDATFTGEEKALQLRKTLDAAHKIETRKQQAEIDRLGRALALKQREYDEVLSQQNDDHLLHLATLQASIDHEKNQGHAAAEAAKSAITNLQQQLRMMLNALDTKGIEIDRLTSEKHQLQQQVTALQNELTIEKKRATKATAECSNLELQVADLQRSLDGLERLNNIRLCKLKTIKDAMAAKDAAHEEMEAFVEELHHENSDVIRDANALDERQSVLVRKMRYYEQAMAAQKRRLTEANAIVAAFRRDLGILIEDEQSGKRLRIDAIVKLYHKYEPSARNVQREMGTDEAIIQELTRQNMCVEDHRRKLRARVASVAAEKHKLATLFSRDNQKLLEDVHRLTRENHELKRQRRPDRSDLAPRRTFDEAQPVHRSNNDEVPEAVSKEIVSKALDPVVVVEGATETCQVYIPCGIHVSPQPLNAILPKPAPLMRPKTSKPKRVARVVQHTDATRKAAVLRPKSALPGPSSTRKPLLD
ncbi:hypothetical protein ACHHYP_04160 [Achlya hypogyna]|uniref:Uncharacterized protein n=1 Tax=Achlya hypogyna TaxID=1202772 RepID=A0A1V9Z1U7_ACHHY|nr:hypothetical protein ACHHYP_04160 [Achlya hypogyna]